MNCRVCDTALVRKKRSRRELALCPVCLDNLEKAIARWVKDIDEDLKVLEAFDSYCAMREQRANSLVS